LESFVVGRRIERVEVGRERTVRRTSAQALIDGLTGATITSIGRRGKYIVCALDTGDALMIHLRMSGRILLAAAGSPRPAHTHVVLHLAGEPAEEMWFIDPRTFGEMVVFDPQHVDVEIPDLAKLGLDPITDDITAGQLARVVTTRARQIKPLLLDQHVIAGIGNIYCDEILHRAKIRPDRLSNTLTRAEVRRLHDSITVILRAAIDAGGSTLSDTQYVDVMGDGGSFQLDHRVYDRAGQRCLTCPRATIVRTVSGGRSTCYCPRCQR
jgi:formamidopyrimidine-DNA glycosylase